MKRKFKQSVVAALLVLVMLIAAPVVSTLGDESSIQPLFTASALLSADDPNLTREAVRQEMYDRYKRIYDFVGQPMISVDAQAVPSAGTEAITAKAEEITADCSTNAEKAEAIYIWIADNIYYDYDFYEGRKNTVYLSSLDVLEYKYTVCEGYANLYNAMCRSVGVPCRKVSGYSDTGHADDESYFADYFKNQSNHAWNEVYVDGEWIVVDSTWGSGNSYINGEFNKAAYTLSWYGMDFYEFTATHMGMSYDSVFESDQFDFEIYREVITAGNYRGTATDIVIPEGIAVIEDMSATNKNITSVVFPSTLTTIGYEAFKDCTGLKSIVIPDTVTKLGSSAFAGCTALETAVIGSGITSVPSGCFNGCTSLKTVDISEEITEIGSGAFYECNSLETITGAENVKILRSQAFMRCTLLKDCDFFNNLTRMEFYAIRECENLTSVTLPYTYSNIDEYNFYNCKSLKKIVIEGDVKYIDEYVFWGCSSLEEVNIPSTVVTIGENAFRGCTSLKSVDLPDGLTEISGCLFYDCPALESIGGDIPAGVTEIGEFAFWGCTSLKSAVLPENLTAIGRSAFSSCSSLTDIGDAFPSGVTSIGSYAFYNAAITGDFTIPDGVTEIPECAFYQCEGITTLTIPASVTSIADFAFCRVNSLTDIYYGGTEEQWNQITFGANNSRFLQAEIHFSEAHQHSYTSTVTTSPTCKSEGVKTYACECGETYTEAIAKTAHTETAIPAVPATCTATGLTEGKKCSVCGEILVEQTVTEMTAHTESDWIIDSNATCSKVGSKHIECTECEAVIKTEAIAKTAHTEAVIPAVPATCSKTGLTEGKKCSVCGEILTAQKETAKLAHTESDWIIDSNATCSKVGSKHIECTECEAVIKTEAIAKTAHTEAVIPAVPATCSKTGLTEGKKCSVCGEILVEQTVTETTAHTESDWIIDSNATCSKVGSKHIECTECEAVIKTEAIAKTAHTEAVIPTVPATCSKTGLTEGKKCSVCGEILVEQTVTEMTAHTESDWIIDSNATCSKVGSKHIECTECEAVIKTEAIAKTAHTETAIPAIPATCTATGLTEGKKCSVCGEILVEQTVTETTAHTESDWIIDSNATCSKVGSKHIECTECEAVIKTEAIAKTAHTEAVIPAVPATCSKTGLTEGKKCSVCGEILTAQKETAKLAHTESDWIIDSNATCSKVGSKHIECTECEAVIKTEAIAKTAHTEAVIPAVSATCSKTGLTEGKKCSVCGEILTAQKETAKLAHTESDWIIDSNATCSKVGSKHIECTECEAVIKTEAIAKTAHTEAVIPAVPATCSKTGLTEGKKCFVCGEILTAQKETAKLAHTESDWIIDSNATCSKVGSKHIECTECEAVIKTEAIAKTAHTEAVIPAVPATCSKTGLTEGKKCSVCGTVTLAQKTTSKLSHTDGNSDDKCDLCGVSTNPADTCSHMCHKSGFMGFIWSIVKAFSKLFKINPVCECGTAHY